MEHEYIDIQKMDGRDFDPKDLEYLATKAESRCTPYDWADQDQKEYLCLISEALSIGVAMMRHQDARDKMKHICDGWHCDTTCDGITPCEGCKSWLPPEPEPKPTPCAENEHQWSEVKVYTTHDSMLGKGEEGNTGTEEHRECQLCCTNSYVSKNLAGEVTETGFFERAALKERSED